MRLLLAKTANISDPSSKTDEQLKQGTVANFGHTCTTSSENFFHSNSDAK